MKSISIYFLLLLFTTFIMNGQNPASPMRSFDTLNLVVRICQGDLPGQKKDLSKDYFKVVCAYTFNNNNLISYIVKGFDLVDKDSTSANLKIAFAEGNQLTPLMLKMIIDANDNMDNLFFDNVILKNRKGETLKISGLRPFMPNK